MLENRLKQMCVFPVLIQGMVMQTYHFEYICFSKIQKGHRIIFLLKD